MKKSTSQQMRPKFQTRKGTKPNTRSERLVTVKLNGIVKRVKESEAIRLVSMGFQYCPKSELKEYDDE